jgi:hypothetical protein
MDINLKRRARERAIASEIANELYHALATQIPITDVGSHFNPQSYIRNAEAAFRNSSVTEFLHRWFEDGRVADRSKKKGKENR